MNRPQINLAFVGSGNWARKYHFPALDYLAKPPYDQRFDLRLQGIYSLEREVATAVADQHGFERVYADLDTLVHDDQVNAVAIAVTPNALKSVVERVLEKQVPILSEKPPGVSSEEAQALSALVNVPNVLAFNRRFAPLNNTFKELVEGLEQSYFVEGHFLRHHRLDETFMIGTGIHWINFMNYLFGDIMEIEVERWQNPQNETWLRIAHFVFEGGLRGLLKVFPCSGSEAEQLEVHTNATSLYLDGPLWTDPGEIAVDSGEVHQVIDPEREHPLPEIVRLGIVDEYLELFRLVSGEGESRSTFQNAVNSMRVAEAMERGVDIA